MPNPTPTPAPALTEQLRKFAEGFYGQARAAQESEDREWLKESAHLAATLEKAADEMDRLAAALALGAADAAGFGNWQIVETVGGTVRIDDVDEDCPVATFHQGTAEARRNAAMLLGALARQAEREAAEVKPTQWEQFQRDDSVRRLRVGVRKATDRAWTAAEMVRNEHIDLHDLRSVLRALDHALATLPPAGAR